MQLNAVSKQRIYSIDVLRGIVMIIMALDHVRDYFHITASVDSPTNLVTTTPMLFFTRWITHFCAPTFILLSGISAYLMGLNKTKKDLSKFLITRGIWLVFMEVAIVSLGWTFDPLYHVLILQVIWAIGISMIFLGLFVWLPVNVVLLTGLAILFCHNMLDRLEIERHGHVGFIWEIAHQGSFKVFTFAPKRIAFLIYAFLPWMGVMFTGYGIGRIFASHFVSQKRRVILFSTGAGALLLFVILRLFNGYGDPAHWNHQKTHFFSFLSFIDISKYPPSLDYVLVTVGVALFALGLLDRITKDSFSFARIFGRVPFFYYVLHLFLIHFITVIFFFSEGYGSKDILGQGSPFFFRPDKFGFGLPVVYLIWILVIAILYPACKWYNGYKSTHNSWWLSYI